MRLHFLASKLSYLLKFCMGQSVIRAYMLRRADRQIKKVASCTAQFNQRMRPAWYMKKCCYYLGIWIFYPLRAHHKEMATAHAQKRTRRFLCSRRLHKIHYKLSTPLLYPLQCVLVKFNTMLLYYEENAWSAFELGKIEFVCALPACWSKAVGWFLLHQAHSATSDWH